MNARWWKPTPPGMYRYRGEFNYLPVDDRGRWHCPQSPLPGRSHISGGTHCVDCGRPIHYPPNVA